MKEWVVMELVQMFALPVLILILSIWVINLSTDGKCKLVKNKLITNTALVFAFYVLAMISPNGDLETIIFMASGSLIAISINTRKLMGKQESNSIIGLSTASLVMMSLSISTNEELTLFSLQEIGRAHV